MRSRRSQLLHLSEIARNPLCCRVSPGPGCRQRVSDRVERLRELAFDSCLTPRILSRAEIVRRLLHPVGQPLSLQLTGGRSGRLRALVLRLRVGGAGGGRLLQPLLQRAQPSHELLLFGGQPLRRLLVRRRLTKLGHRGGDLTLPIRQLPRL
jgi:hypothetical protein